MKGIDIYLIDQILKDRYTPGETILDAGGGGGRNLKWFLQEGFEVIIQDIDPERELQVQEKYPEAKYRWMTEELSELSLKSNSVDHVICNAVLHFAKDRRHFDQMLDQLVRVCRSGGSIFIRTNCIFGVEDSIKSIGDGWYNLPDESDRFLIDAEIFDAIKNDPRFELGEIPKWTSVNGLRVMMTLVLIVK
ncbi:class I SAM-dependent methyltransferase [Sanyastnella coralliicola]|uniref:class I SAM-dependent methyltransferase n=1 Tax=Sanyastnella coralliicola TaxID=3069118 RepID=UPI0027BA9885|nr:class I SAM-dependent methyltransferase [Longitalea sp. SCSIO 12813]